MLRWWYRDAITASREVVQAKVAAALDVSAPGVMGDFKIIRSKRFPLRHFTNQHHTELTVISWDLAESILGATAGDPLCGLLVQFQPEGDLELIQVTAWTQ